MTGQRCAGSPVWCWVWESIFSPFFWLTNMTVINSAIFRSTGSECATMVLLDVRNVRPSTSVHLVLPTKCGFEYLHDHMAKKKTPVIMSVMTTYAMSRMDG